MSMLEPKPSAEPIHQTTSEAIRRSGRAGQWWVLEIQFAGSNPLYWTGRRDRDDRPNLTGVPASAAQFHSREGAEMARTLFGLGRLSGLRPAELRL